MSRQYFETNSFTVELRKFVAKHLEENFGHGLEHAIKVAIDAGALMIIENKLAQQPDNRINRRVAVVQWAGLLHDIKRKKKNHAIKGSDHARKVLKPYPLDPSEVDDICRAIRNHEAFKPTVKADTIEGALVSDCLYDADKFRWGPDNFTDTLWAMVSDFKIPVVEFMDLYPEGVEKLAEIKHTFRTRTGKKYGPQFIDLGVAIGKELFNVINTEFAHLL
ncbi:MAG: HD domain-containing protein [Desulfobacterales bacterium]